MLIEHPEQIPYPDYRSDSAHSEYSPSGSKRWLNCTASITAIRDLKHKDSEASEHALEGTSAHALGEECLNNYGTEFLSDANSYIGQKFETHIVDDEMANQVNKYVNYVESLMTKGSTLWVEARFNMNKLQKEMMGTSDATIIHPFDSEIVLDVVDLKYGRGVVVEPHHNTQMMIYALGALFHLASKGVRFTDDNKVRMSISQPRISHPEGPNRAWITTVGQLRTFSHEVRAAVKQAEDGGVFVPGEDQCRWCQAGPHCAARARWNVQEAVSEWEDVLLEENEFEDLINERYISDEEFGAILAKKKIITDWLTSIESKARAMLMNGKKVHRHKLISGRSHRRWEDEKKAEKTLLAIGIPKEKLYKPAKLCTAPAMEKILTKEEWGKVKDLVIKPDGAPKLVLDTHPSEAYTPATQAADDWADEKLDYSEAESDAL